MIGKGQLIVIIMNVYYLAAELTTRETKLIELKGEIDKPTITLRMLPLPFQRLIKLEKKVVKTAVMKNAINLHDLLGIYEHYSQQQHTHSFQMNLNCCSDRL